MLASVLKDTLPIESIPADVPASIRRLLKRCLQKDRAERLDSMAAARLEIADALSGESRTDASSVSVASHVTPPAKRAWLRPAAMMIVVAALAAWAGSAWNRNASGESSAVVAFNVPTPAEVTSVAITPSGDQLVLESDRLYVRSLSDTTLRPIPGTDGGRNLAMSTDGKWVAFVSSNQLKKVALAGGDPLAITELTDDSPGFGWGPANSIYFTPGWNAALFSVSADGGGKPKAASTIDTAAGEMSHWWPQLLPDQTSMIFTIWMAGAGINDAKIGVLDLGTGKHRVIAPGAFARYLPSGHVVYFHAGKYYAAKFDLAAMKLVGDPVAIMDDVLAHDPLGQRKKPWAASANGTLVSIVGPLLPKAQWAWAAPDGRIARIDIPIEAVHSSDLSLDGRWLVTSRVEGGLNGLWLTDLSRQTQTKITLPASNFTPRWSPSGRSFVFTSLRAGHFDAWQYRVDESRAVAVIDAALDQMPIAVSRDENTIILNDSTAGGQLPMTYATFKAPDQRKVIEGLPPTEDVVFSPDDKWIAAEYSVDGRSQIVVRPFPGTGHVTNITPSGGSQPRWPPSGSRIFYQRDHEVVAVTYSLSGGRFSVSDERVLFRLAQRFHLAGVAPDGRFLVELELPDQSRQTRVVLNWFSQLPK